MGPFVRVGLRLEDKDLVLKGPVSHFIANEFSVKWNLRGRLHFSISWKKATSPL